MTTTYRDTARALYAAMVEHRARCATLTRALATLATAYESLASTTEMDRHAAIRYPAREARRILLSAPATLPGEND